MFKVKCRCGASEKSFKKNIGDFYIDECCEKAGYDYQGNLTGQVKFESKQEVIDIQPSPTVVKVPNETPVKKPGRGKLRDMRLEDLKVKAREKGIPGCEEMTKAQLIDAILG